MNSALRSALFVAACPAAFAFVTSSGSGPLAHTPTARAALGQASGGTAQYLEGDAYRIGFHLQPSPRGYRIVPWNFLDVVDPSREPSSWPDPVQLETFGTPGEYEYLGFAVYADQAVPHVSLTASALEGPGGAIPSDSIDVRWVMRSREREKATDPASQTRITSRFLLNEPDVDLEAQTFHQVLATVHVPESIPAGVYKATWILKPEGGQATDVDVALTVLPFRLGGTGGRQYGLYYTVGNISETDRINRELADIRAHGANMLIPGGLDIAYKQSGGQVVPDYGRLTRGLDLIRAHGFHGTVVVNTGFVQLAQLLGVDPGRRGGRGGERQLEAVGKQALEGLVALAKNYPEFRIVVTHMGEVTRQNRMEEYIALTKVVRQVPDLRMYVSLSLRPSRRVERMRDRVAPYVDIRGYPGFQVDAWLKAGHTFGELAGDLKSEGNEAWVYYNRRGAFFIPQWTWLVNSYYMWMSPFQASVPWTYYQVHGNPLDDLDQPDKGGHDYGYAVPSPDGTTMISTLDWEGYRAGIQDFRYLTMLDSLTRQAKTAAPAAASAAQSWLDQLHKRMPRLPGAVADISGESPVLQWFSDNYTGKDYDAWRRKTADEIINLERALSGSGGGSGQSP